MKKLSCIVLAFFCIFAFAPAFASGSSLDSASAAIVKDVANIHNVSEALCRVVPISIADSSQTAKANFSSSSAQKAILVVRMLPNDAVETTLILPFKELPNGKLVNSFEYAASLGSIAEPKSTGERVVPLYDVDASMRATYKVYTAAILNTLHAGQMYKGGFKWTKANSSSSATVTQAKITVAARGRLYSVPDYVNEPTLLNSNYNKSKTTTLTNPSSGSWHYTASLMSTSEGVVRPYTMEDGGWVAIDVNYKNANGTSQSSYGTTLTCFSK